MSNNNSSDNKSGQNNGMEYHSGDEDEDNFWADKPDEIICMIVVERLPEKAHDALTEVTGGMKFSNELSTLEIHARGMDARAVAAVLRQALDSVKDEARREARQELLEEHISDELRKFVDLSNDVLKGRRDN